MQFERFNNWRVAHYGIGGVPVVPGRAGVYAIMSMPRVYGLPRSVDALYVGRTLNLKRRLC